MSAHSMKIAISLPKSVMTEIESVRHRLGLARSQAIQEAVSFWLKKREEEQLIKKYIEGYKRKPENAADVEALWRAGLSSFSKDEW